MRLIGLGNDKKPRKRAGGTRWNPDCHQPIYRNRAERSRARGAGAGIAAARRGSQRSARIRQRVCRVDQSPWDAIFVPADPLFFQHRTRLAELAAKTRLPAMWGIRDQAEAGGLMAYGVNLVDLSRRAAIYVDKILKGAKPSDLPIGQPTKFDLVINMKTAKALGLTIRSRCCRGLTRSSSSACSIHAANSYVLLSASPGVPCPRMTAPCGHFAPGCTRGRGLDTSRLGCTARATTCS
jgi:hypothetical protein